MASGPSAWTSAGRAPRAPARRVGEDRGQRRDVRDLQAREEDEVPRDDGDVGRGVGQRALEHRRAAGRSQASTRAMQSSIRSCTLGGSGAGAAASAAVAASPERSPSDPVASVACVSHAAQRSNRSSRCAAAAQQRGARAPRPGTTTSASSPGDDPRHPPETTCLDPTIRAGGDVARPRPGHRLPCTLAVADHAGCSPPRRPSSTRRSSRARS